MAKKIKGIIVHCSDSEFGNSLTIDKWHKQKGWAGIGYHVVILNGKTYRDIYNPFLDGSYESGRPLDGDDYITGQEVGAHAYGLNREYIGICLIGKKNFTLAQDTALWHLVKYLCKTHSLDLDTDVVGHRDLDSNKTCPNFDVKKWVQERKEADVPAPAPSTESLQSLTKHLGSLAASLAALIGRVERLESR